MSSFERQSSKYVVFPERQPYFTSLGRARRRARGSDWSQNSASKASKASHASEVSITHLELRSPMFGETCVSKSMSEFEIVFSFYVVFR